MADALIMSAGGGGDSSSDCNVTENYVVKGKTYIGADTDDEVGTGTLELTGNATSANVLSGKTFYSNNPHSKLTGTIPTLGENAFGDAGWSGSFDNSPIVLAAWNAHVGAFDYPLHGYFDSDAVRVHIPNMIPANIKAGVQIGGKNGYIPGAFTNDANATASQILSGYTAYVKGAKVKGSLEVQSILSFNCAVYSSTAITFTWKNPAKGAFSGVIIVGKTGSYPTNIEDGTRYYKGAGNNTTANGISSATVDSFTSGTTYYFRAFSYAVKNNTEWIHGTTYTGAAETTKGQQVFTSSGTFTVPAGVRSIDVFCVGGGGGGKAGENQKYNLGTPWLAGCGGGGGYTTTKKSISVSPEQQYAVVIGAGGLGGVQNGLYPGDGGITSFGSLTSAKGGSGKAGGSGGGGASYLVSGPFGGDGGSNGSNGGTGSGSDKKGYGYGGTGQGTTTCAFGESSNTLYAGGGGGGGGIELSGESDGETYGNNRGGAGGAGGGGRGAGSLNGDAIAGIEGTGGGGGGGCRGSSRNWVRTNIKGAAGGSGVLIVRWGY